MPNYEIHAVFETREPLSERDREDIFQIFESCWASAGYSSHVQGQFHVYRFCASKDVDYPAGVLAGLAENIGHKILGRFSKDQIDNVGIDVVHLDEHPTDSYLVTR